MRNGWWGRAAMLNNKGRGAINSMCFKAGSKGWRGGAVATHQLQESAKKLYCARGDKFQINRIKQLKLQLHEKTNNVTIISMC